MNAFNIKIPEEYVENGDYHWAWIAGECGSVVSFNFSPYK